MLTSLNDVLSPQSALRLLSLADKRDVASTEEVFVKVREALLAHPLFVLAASPRTLSRPVFRSLAQDEERAAHVREAVVDGMRADLAVTLFLQAPEASEGGEVLVDTGFGEESYKPPQGGCIVYPASAQVRVARVQQGAHLTVELAVQSWVRDPVQREILYDVGCSLHLLELFGGDRPDEVERLRRSQQNLLRMWSEA